MIQPLKKLAEFFGSIRLAIILIIITTIVSLFGVIIPQELAPAQYLHKWGPVAGQALLAIGFDHVFSTFWFYTLLILFSCNILVCSSTRLWKNTRNSLKKSFLSGKAAFGQFKHSMTFSSHKDGLSAENAIAAYLKRRHWGVKVQRGDSGVQVAARQGLLKDIGSLVFHVSIVILLVGGLIGTRFGYASVKELVKGQTISVPDRSFNLRCDWFRVARNNDGSVKEYQSKLSIVGPDNVVLAEKVVQVNSPLAFQGIRFYQSSYGESSGTIADVALQLFGPGLPNGIFSDTIPYDSLCQIPKSNISVLVTQFLPDFIIDMESHEASTRSDEPNNPAIKVLLLNGKDTLYDHWSFFKYPEQHEASGAYKVIADSYTPSYNTGIQIRRNPGEPVIWFGIVFMTIGLLAVFYVPRKNVWILIEPTSSAGSEITLGWTAIKAAGDSQKEFEKTTSSLKEILR
jgi:cytochrome c biogenesis protein